MQKGFWKSIGKANSFIAIFLLCVSLRATGRSHADDFSYPSYMEKGRLKLKDGRSLDLYKNDAMDSNCTRLSLLGHRRRSLWRHLYCESFDTLWVQTFFIPIKKGQFEMDLNHDGYPEVAIAVSDLGNSLGARSAVIFSVKERELVPYAIASYHIESGEPLFP